MLCSIPQRPSHKTSRLGDRILLLYSARIESNWTPEKQQRGLRSSSQRERYTYGLAVWPYKELLTHAGLTRLIHNTYLSCRSFRDCCTSLSAKIDLATHALPLPDSDSILARTFERTVVTHSSRTTSGTRRRLAHFSWHCRTAFLIKVCVCVCVCVCVHACVCACVGVCMRAPAFLWHIT